MWMKYSPSMPRGRVTASLRVYRSPAPSAGTLPRANEPRPIARDSMNSGSGEMKTSSVQYRVPAQAAAPALTTVQEMTAFSPEKFVCGVVIDSTRTSPGASGTTGVGPAAVSLVVYGPSHTPEPVWIRTYLPAISGVSAKVASAVYDWSGPSRPVWSSPGLSLSRHCFAPG